MQRLGAKLSSHIVQLGDRPQMDKLIGAVKVMLDGYTSRPLSTACCSATRASSIRMKQEPVIEQLLPLSGERLGAPETVWDYIYEPEARAVLDQVMTRYIEALIYQAVVGKHGFRAVGPHGGDESGFGQRRHPDRRADADLQQEPTGRHYQGAFQKSSAALPPYREPGKNGNKHKAPSSSASAAVIDIQFSRDAMPGIYDALLLEADAANPLAEKDLTFEVEQQLGDGVVRCIALGSSDGLRRGMKVKATGEPISVPVGKGTLGRIMDVLGRPIDEGGPIKGDQRRSIHQIAPKFDELSPSVELLETGIKVIDLICPVRQGRQNRPVSAARASARRSTCWS